MKIEWKTLVLESQAHLEQDLSERIEAAERWASRLRGWRSAVGTPPPLFRKRADNRPARSLEEQIAQAEYEVRRLRGQLRVLKSPTLSAHGPKKRVRKR